MWPELSPIYLSYYIKEKIYKLRELIGPGSNMQDKEPRQSTNKIKTSRYSHVL